MPLFHPFIFGMPLKPGIPIPMFGIFMIAGFIGMFMFMPIIAGLKPGIIIGFIMF